MLEIMEKPTIFVSCGQRTDDEKRLGVAICDLVSSVGAFTPFFAQEQSDLNGLHDNIMGALERAVGFIAVMHPRGNVIAPGTGNLIVTRASVWVEQEIAIAAFINRSRKQKIPTAVYCHRSVGREGMRNLLHLNPTVFEYNEEVIGHLSARLPAWVVNESKDADGELSLRARPTYSASLGRIVTLTPIFHNDGPRANQYSCTMHLPTLLVKDSGPCWVAIPSQEPGYNAYQFTETNRNSEPILNGSTVEFMVIEGSMTNLNSAERAALANLPIRISAQIGERFYKAVVPVADAFPLAARGAIS
jgi:hypothetical protein